MLVKWTEAGLSRDKQRWKYTSQLNYSLSHSIFRFCPSMQHWPLTLYWKRWLGQANTSTHIHRYNHTVDTDRYSGRHRL